MDSIKTALLHPFFILRVVRLQRYGSEKQIWTVFFFYLTTQLGNFNSNKPSLLTA